MSSRREFLRIAGGMLAVSSGILVPRNVFARADSLGPSELPAGTLEESILSALPGKQALIKRTFRAPNYETPVESLNEMFTPNMAFFVRWHLAVIPEINTQAWRLRIAGDSAQQPMELTYEDLRKFPAVEVAAVNMCAGNRRGLSHPHVPGVQWGNGAMGNARWRGARLKDILDRAGVKKDAVEIAFQGQDKGTVAQTPQFAKSLPMWKALDDDTILAYEMNGRPLPLHNGWPVRLIVPGWVGTYWMKQIIQINILPRPFDGYWMKSAYRIPLDKFPQLVRFTSQEAHGVNTTPITEVVVNSLITNIKDGQRFGAEQPIVVQGIAWDAGRGIQKVDISMDGGQTWRSATLEKEYGNYSWRQWRYQFHPAKPGRYRIVVKATNRQGETQKPELIWNPAGYHNNVPQQVNIEVA
jgi:DMSO/TMAO reductase YedYZ molybdopterin-dependent catalytic subunit